MNALWNLVITLIVAAAVVLGLVSVYEGGRREDARRLQTSPYGAFTQ
jgi:hypothetical protein